MAERLSLELELLDKVGGPAKKAAAALRGVEDQAKKTNKALDFSSEVGKAHDALKKLKVDPKGYQDLLKAQAHLRQEREKLKKSMSNDHGGFLASFKHALPFRSVGDYFKGAFWGHLAAEGVEKIAEGFVEGAHMAIEVIYDGLKDAFKAIAKEQERIAGYDLTLGKPRSKEERESIEQWSKKTAFSGSQNTDMMLPLFRAGLGSKAATTAYATALDLAAGRGKGADQNAVAEAVDLFAKIQNKGSITTKMLANVGLGEKNVPAFFKDLGKTLHVSASEAEKRATAGKVDPQIMMNAITDAVNRMQGGKAGTGALVAGKSLAGQWNKLKELPENFFEKMVHSPALGHMSEALGRVLEQLNPDGPTGKRIFLALERAFTGLVDWIARAFTPENIDKFGNAIQSVIGFISQIPTYLNQAVKIGEVLATIFVGKKIVDAITAAVTGLSAASAPLIATAAAAVAVYEAVTQINKAVNELGGAKAVGRDLMDYGKPAAVSRGNEGYAAMEAENQRNVARAREAAIRQSISMINNNVVHVDAGGDPTHTGQKAGVAIAGGMTKELERARAEAGAR